MLEWQRQILIRDKLRLISLISEISSLLYPELPSVFDRESKLLKVPEMARLRNICLVKLEKIVKDLGEV